MTDLTSHSIRRAPDRDAREFDAVILDYEGRFLRRKVLTTRDGRSMLVDLPETVSLNDGDAFETVNGKLVAVVAAPEPLIEVSASAVELARLAWHIGNRHTPAQISGQTILIRRDHVMADMLGKLGALTRDVIAPFTPEGGAYGHGRTHGHHHGHDAKADPNTGIEERRTEHGATKLERLS